MGLFSQNTQNGQQAAPAQITERQKYQNKFKTARTNLFSVVAFSFINLIMLFLKLGGEFLFSAQVPYDILSFGMIYTGMYPEKMYEDFESWEFFDKKLFYITLIIAVVIICLYLLCAVFSKNQKPGWFVFATVLFTADTLLLVMDMLSDYSLILNLIFHIWVMYYLIVGIVSTFKLKKMPPEELEGIALNVPNGTQIADWTPENLTGDYDQSEDYSDNSDDSSEKQ